MNEAPLRGTHVVSKTFKTIYTVDDMALRALRLLRQQSLRGLAKALVISPTYLQRLETEAESARVSPTLASRIEAWCGQTGGIA